MSVGEAVLGFAAPQVDGANLAEARAMNSARKAAAKQKGKPSRKNKGKHKSHGKKHRA